ncbi:MAG: HupE/UreJ family protein, partial [Bryobacteraceae bacterium]
MKTKLIATAAIILSVARPISAHRLDQYLQATIISVEKDRVQLFMRLVPGVAVAAAVLADIDTNRDGILSENEQRAYSERVLRDLSLSIDGNRLSPRLVSVGFPNPEEMRAGLGEIKIEFTADLPRGVANRKIIFENHHETRTAAYLVNCLVPLDKDIHVTAQSRNELQSFYELDYEQAGSGSGPPSVDSSSGGRSMLATILFWFRAFAGMYRLGLRHIAEGTDHLLFLLTLLLPAPLLAVGSRWAGSAGVHHSLLQIMKIVTAFTVGHSITLALAAWGLIRVPGRPIEALIAVSILVSAIHALRPLFPGREAVVASFF